MDIQELEERVYWLMCLTDDEINNINHRLEEIEDRLDQIQKKGKYREPGPSPYMPRKPEPKERFY